MKSGTISYSIKNFVSSASISVIAFVLSMVVGGMIVIGIGKNPFEVYGALIQGAIGSPLSLTGTINRMVPIIFSGMAIAFGSKCAVFNIGVEGQILIGSYLAIAVGVLIDLPPVLHVLFCVVAGMIGGSLWATIPAILRHYKNVSIIFSAIMMNYVARYLLMYLIPMLPEYDSVLGISPKIDESAMLPLLFPRPFAITSGILIAFLAVAFVYVYIYKTKAGFQLRAVGFNQLASKCAGINIKANMFLAMIISGAFAGLAGSTEIVGTTFRMPEASTNTYMATGIAVAMLAKGNPIAIVFASFLFAGMRNGSTLMQTTTGVTGQFVFIIQGLIIIFICSENFFKWIVAKIKIKLKEKKL